VAVEVVTAVHGGSVEHHCGTRGSGAPAAVRRLRSSNHRNRRARSGGDGQGFRVGTKLGAASPSPKVWRSCRKPNSVGARWQAF
jgi:hypothetical protein